MTIGAFLSCMNRLGGQRNSHSPQIRRTLSPRTLLPTRASSASGKLPIALAVGLLAAAVAGEASADLIAYDQFVGYDAGQLVGQGKGFGWANAWQGDTDYTVSSSGGLTHGYLPDVTDGGSASTGSAGGSVSRDLGTPITSPGSYYFGFLMKASGNAHNAYLGLVENGDGTGNLLYGGSWNSNSTWRLAKRDGSSYWDRDTHVAETANTTLFVLKLYMSASGTDASSLYVNPANAAVLSGTPNAYYTFTHDFGRVSTVRAGLSNRTGATGSFIFDEVRIGTEAGDMFSEVPEPTSLALLAVAGLALWKRRK